MSESKKPLAVYTKFEAAEILRVKVSWLERRAAKRLIPFSMLGGEYRFTDEHLQAILRLNESTPSAAPPEATVMEPAPRRRRTGPRPTPRTSVAPLRARAPKRASA